MEATLKQIGVVRSSVKNCSEMPGDGVPAAIEVFPEYLDGLTRLMENTAITVIAWLHHGEREALVGRAGSYSAGRGVFASRSPSRPNPLGISTTPLLAVEGNLVRVEALDFIDGTPVVDLKSPSRGWDYVWSATTLRDQTLALDIDHPNTLKRLLREARWFHGEDCAGVVVGTRLVADAVRAFGVGARHPQLEVTMGRDGCVADAVQALTGASLGNKRMRCGNSAVFYLSYGGQTRSYTPLANADRAVEELLSLPAEALFDVRQEPPGAALPEEPLAVALSGEQLQALEAGLAGSKVKGKVPCAAAFRLASQLGISPHQLGEIANQQGIRVSHCQLGCFK